MEETLARTIFKAWPFTFGHVRILNALSPPTPSAAEATTRLRGYDLKFRFDPRTYIGQFLYYRGMFEEKIVSTIASLLDPGAAYVDVGANIGLHAVVAARAVGSSGRVLAFEPQSACRKRLEENAAINGLSNIRLLPYAVGKEAGSARIYTINKDNDGQSTLKPESLDHPYEDVSVVTLDSLELPDAFVLKVDVEGGEMDVLRGAARVLREKRVQHLFAEVIDSYLARFGSSRREFLEYLISSGYRVKGLFGGRWIEVGPDAQRDMDIWAQPL